MPGSCTGVINLRYGDGVEGSPSRPARFLDQDYEQLKQQHCASGSLFLDDTFRPDLDSLGDIPSMVFEEMLVEWKRPKDILSGGKPSFTVDGLSRFDFQQGRVGNCWFLAGIGSLTFQEDLLLQVVPMEQSFDEDYAGIFHFRFWKSGQWVDVVIDDLLPVLFGQLMSVNTKSGNEFWGPLLEKAYAKLCGSYAAMSGGRTSEAFRNFSGGLSMECLLNSKHNESHDEELWTLITRATQCQSMICASTPSNQRDGSNSLSGSGLVYSHAYCVTGVTEVNHDGTTSRLVRLLNPWGQQEWNGKWSDNSSMWNRVRPEDREQYTNRNNGEFWMNLDDFCSSLSRTSICCENPNFMDGEMSRQWKCMPYDGSWVAGKSAGGQPYYSSYWTNPQYRFTVAPVQGQEGGEQKILLSLVQKLSGQRKKSRKTTASVNLYKVPSGTPKGKLDKEFLQQGFPLRSQNDKLLVNFSNENHMYSVEPGEYLAVPYTSRPNFNGNFVLLLYTQADSDFDGHEGDNHNEEEEKPADKDELHEMFQIYAQEEELSCEQLQLLLNENFPHGIPQGFDLYLSSQLIIFMTGKNTVNLTFDDFVKLWNKFEEYKGIFRKEDVSKSGTVPVAFAKGEVVRRAKDEGKECNMPVLHILARYYSSGKPHLSLGMFCVLLMDLDNINKIL